MGESRKKNKIIYREGTNYKKKRGTLKNTKEEEESKEVATSIEDLDKDIVATLLKMYGSPNPCPLALEKGTCQDLRGVKKKEQGDRTRSQVDLKLVCSPPSHTIDIIEEIHPSSPIRNRKGKGPQVEDNCRIKERNREDRCKNLLTLT